MIRTVIVEDNLFMQNHIVSLLEDDGRFQIEAVLKDAFEAESVCRSLDADLVLMDVQTQHNHSGLASGKRILEEHPGIRVVVITSLIDPEVLAKARQGCASSLWYKDYGDSGLISVIVRTMEGENIFPDSAPNAELKDMYTAEISPRQLQILRMYVEGKTYDEIASELKITRSGVRWNLEQIVEKGGFENKHQMLAAVIEKKLVVTTLRDDAEDI